MAALLRGQRLHALDGAAHLGESDGLPFERLHRRPSHNRPEVLAVLADVIEEDAPLVDRLSEALGVVQRRAIELLEEDLLLGAQVVEAVDEAF